MQNKMKKFRLVVPWQEQPAHDCSAARQDLVEREIPHGERHSLEKQAIHFILDPELETAINTALAVSAPILLTGEPGTGKTQTAYFIQRYFGINLYTYQVRSTSTAEDLKWDFDAVAYLQEAYRARERQTKPRIGLKISEANTERRKIGTKDDPRLPFLNEGTLWMAFEDKRPSVLLLDEIDKAPRDFPNDLLQELAQYKFKHPFIKGKWINLKAPVPPIVVITSNDERRLPDAFLRRCIYHRIELTKDLIANAVNSRFPALDPELKEAALARFWDLRKHRHLQKKPSTAELIAWLTVLTAQEIEPDDLKQANLKELPARMVLIKDQDDIKRL
jgi:MoxR-like ATPase